MKIFGKTYKILIGKKMPFSCFGLSGCSHGMYSRNSFNRWHYGLKGVFGLYVEERW